jgi:uncharacterized RDD family membrane protein YckC
MAKRAENRAKTAAREEPSRTTSLTARIEPARSRRAADDVVMGLVVTTVRAGMSAARISLLPIRVVGQMPGISTFRRRTTDNLAAAGRDARARGSHELERGTRAAFENALAGPLPERVARSLVDHEIVERVAGEIVETADVDRIVADVLEHDVTDRVVQQVLQSPEMQRALEHALSSPQVRSALANQTTGLADELADGLRRRAYALDDSIERRVGRRPEANLAERAPFAGVVSRGFALIVDLLVTHLAYLVGSALVALVASLVGTLRPAWLVAALAASGWFLLVGSYFVLFWTVVGQTPGMRLMRLRVERDTGEALSFGRSILRFVGLLLAIVPLFAGFLPALFDRRRRALQDMIAGTVVVYDKPGASHSSGVSESTDT